MRILITGGAGFLGSHLCDRLIRDGNDVICLDNFFTGSKDNIRHHLNHPNFELIRHDVVNPILLEVDQIYNMACPASPVHYQYNPVKTINTAISGTIHMLELAKAADARMLQASTSEVYGNPTVHPQTEDYFGNVNPIGIRSCYDEGKRAGEALCMDYHRQYHVDIRIARIFNTYGPRMALNDGRVVSNFIIQALKNEDITLFGDGRQTRSFCYVDDLVEGLIRLMNSDYDQGPMNIGNPGEFTVMELAEMVIRLTGAKSKIIQMPLPADDPVRRCPDIRLAKAELGFEPRVPLEVGIIRTIDYFEKALMVSPASIHRIATAPVPPLLPRTASDTAQPNA